MDVARWAIGPNDAYGRLRGAGGLDPAFMECILLEVASDNVPVPDVDPKITWGFEVGDMLPFECKFSPPRILYDGCSHQEISFLTAPRDMGLFTITRKDGFRVVLVQAVQR